MFFPSVESRTSGLSECTDASCALFGMTQPEHVGQSVVEFGSDGTVTTIQRGATLQNEANVPSIAARLELHLPRGLRVESATGPEVGTDLRVVCEVCGHKTELQIVRSMDPDLARRAAGPDGAAWTTSSAL